MASYIWPNFRSLFEEMDLILKVTFSKILKGGFDNTKPCNTVSLGETYLDWDRLHWDALFLPNKEFSLAIFRKFRRQKIS